MVQNEEDGDEMDDSLLGEMEDTSDGGTVNDGTDDQLPVLPVWVRDVWRCSRCPRLFWVGPKSRRTVMHLEAVVKPLGPPLRDDVLEHVERVLERPRAQAGAPHRQR